MAIVTYDSNPFRSFTEERDDLKTLEELLT